MPICVHSLVGGDDFVVAIVWLVVFFCMITDEVLESISVFLLVILPLVKSTQQ